MTTRCVLILVLVALVVASHHDEDEAVQQPDTIFGISEACRVGDQLCSDGCDLLLLCLANHATIIVRNCTETEYLCDSTTFQCVEPDTSTCEPKTPEDHEFMCHSPGMFPNPYDCHTYYTCSATGVHGTLHTCPSNDPTEYGYDPLFNTCSFTAKDRVCVEKPIPVCVVATQSGGQIENPNIYYICVNDPDGKDALLPWLFRCDKANQVFDDVMKECVARIPTTTMTTTTTTEGTGGGEKLPVRDAWLLLMFALHFFRVVN